MDLLLIANKWPNDIISMARHVVYQIEADNEASQLTYFGDLLTYLVWPNNLLNDLTSVSRHVVYQIDADSKANQLTANSKQPTVNSILACWV